MDLDRTIGDLIRELGDDATVLFAELGVELDAWDLELHLIELCHSYELDLHGVLATLEALRRRPHRVGLDSEAGGVGPSSATPHSLSFR